jgi:hypothetical protein
MSRGVAAVSALQFFDPSSADKALMIRGLTAVFLPAAETLGSESLCN